MSGCFKCTKEVVIQVGKIALQLMVIYFLLCSHGNDTFGTNADRNVIKKRLFNIKI